MGAMVKTDPAQVLIKNDIFKEYKGGMTEQYVLQQMKSKGVSPIYYHNTDNSRLELDFVIQRHPAGSGNDPDRSEGRRECPGQFVDSITGKKTGIACGEIFYVAL